MTKRTIKEELEGIIELLPLLCVNVITGDVLWNADVGQRARKGNVAGHKNADGYHVVTYKRKQYLVHRIVYYIHHGILPEYVDHIKGIEAGNGIDNLRECTLPENSRNRKVSKRKNIPYIGVQKHGNKFRADIRSNGKQMYIGLSDTMEGAALLYDAKAKELHGDFAKLNFGDVNGKIDKARD